MLVISKLESKHSLKKYKDIWIKIKFVLIFDHPIKILSFTYELI